MAEIHKLKDPKQLPAEPARTFGLLGLVGKSPQMKEVFELVQKVAPTDANVLISGETGVGKECLARALHMLSRRRDKPHIALNCSAVPESLLESQLFGYVKGAFTGASTAHAGLFREADGGTLLLDEIGELPWSLQAKLLRAIQEKEILPLGASRPQKIDVRIVAATNRDLLARVAIRRFREDLYYRLCTVHMTVPPLRERREDVPDLARFLIRRHSGTANTSYREISVDALRELSSRSWPGNVRELDNVLERAMITGDGHRIGLKDIGTVAATKEIVSNGNLRVALRSFEKAHIERMLAQADGDKERCAELLGISRSSLFQKLFTFRIGSRSHAGRPRKSS